MKVCHESVDAELVIDAHGVLVRAVADAQHQRLTVYLGNYFWVPEHLKRKGLGIALISAIVDTFHMAAFGAPHSDKRVFLEGYFVNEGALFAKAICAGISPSKSQPAEILSTRLLAGRKAVRFNAGPGPIPKPTSTSVSHMR